MLQESGGDFITPGQVQAKLMHFSKLKKNQFNFTPFN